MNNTNTPTREAMLLVSTNGEDFTPALDVDPIDLPVTDGLADAFHPGLTGLMDAVLAWEAVAGDRTEYRLVWSDDRTAVKATCPVCDDFFVVSEGAPGDEANEGYDAMWCGCDPADQDYDAKDSGEFV